MRTLHARARFSARMRGRSTRKRDFRRECEDASTRERDFQREFLLSILLFYYFSNSTVTALANKNSRTLHARARFPARFPFIYFILMSAQNEAISGTLSSLIGFLGTPEALSSSRELSVIDCEKSLIVLCLSSLINLCPSLTLLIS